MSELSAATEGSPEAVKLLQCHLLDTSYCHTLAATLRRGLPWKPVNCHCLVALLQHPQHGWILWDTGYAPRMLEATRRFPWRLYRFATPLHLQPELALVAQLPRFGLTPDDITHVILSHLHADHVAGLRDFPNARVVMSRAAWEDARQRRGFNALRRALIPSLFPDDLTERALFLDDFNGPTLDSLGPAIDLFQDGSLLLFPLPGHARGQVGMLAHVGEKKDVLFVADSCLHRDSARTGVLPGRATYLIADDVRAIAPTVARLHAFVQANPNVFVVPTHCPDTYQEIFGVAP